MHPIDAKVASIQEDSERADVSLYPEPVTDKELSVYESAKLGAVGPGGKFDEARRMRYLEERRRGTPHLTAVRRAGISPSTYDRYSAAAGDQWKEAVRYARDESLDPIRAVRRAAALDREPWAVRAEIGNGADAKAGGAAASIGTQVNVGAVVVGGAAGIEGALGGLIGRLREREAALTDGVIDAEVIE